jgi:hypothetical protein
MEKSVILNLTDVKDIALPILFALLVTLMREVFRSDGPPVISRMLVLEEAHEYLGGQTDRRTSDLKEGEAFQRLEGLEEDRDMRGRRVAADFGCCGKRARQPGHCDMPAPGTSAMHKGGCSCAEPRAMAGA